MVRQELVENPDVDNAVLFEKALQVDPSAMEGVDRRQFNARYPLQIKRREMPPRPPRPGAPKPRRRSRQRDAAASEAQAATPASSSPALRNTARDGVRDVLLRFALDMANAESRGDLVSVVAGVDQYVDQILGLGSPGEPR